MAHNSWFFQGRTIFVCPPLGRTDKICPPLGRTNKLWSLGTFPTFQVPFFQVYFIYFPIFQVEFINFPIFRTLSNDSPILGIKYLYFPPKTVIFSNLSSLKKGTSGQRLFRSGEDMGRTNDLRGGHLCAMGKFIVTMTAWTASTNPKYIYRFVVECGLESGPNSVPEWDIQIVLP